MQSSEKNVSNFGIFSNNQLLYVEAGILFVAISVGLLVFGSMTSLATLITPFYLPLFLALHQLVLRAKDDDLTLEDLFAGELFENRGSIIVGMLFSVFISIVALIVHAAVFTTLLPGVMLLLPLLILANVLICFSVARRFDLLLRGAVFAFVSCALLPMTLFVGAVIAMPIMFIAFFRDR